MQKITKSNKRLGGVAQVVKHFPSKHKALSSNFSTEGKSDYKEV
jgi:hypothetical protein